MAESLSFQSLESETGTGLKAIAELADGSVVHPIHESRDDAVENDPAAGDSDPTIRVCVRVRCFIKEELEGGRSGGVCELCIEMPTKTTVMMVGRGPEPKALNTTGVIGRLTKIISFTLTSKRCMTRLVEA